MTSNRFTMLALKLFGSAPLPALLLTLFLMSSGGCSDSPTDSSGTATAGTISGKVTDSRGNPLKGVRISMVTTTIGGGNVSAANPTTGDDGTFSSKVPDGLYGVTAEYTVMYNGRQYRLYLHPVDGINGDITHDSRNGYVKNFVWKISGETASKVFVPGEPHHHGGVIDIQNQAAYYYAAGDYQSVGTDLPQGSKVDITLTPVGPMLDGTTGAVVTREFLINKTFWYSPQYDLLDIPIGKYTVSATITEPGGATKSLRVSTLPGNDSTLDPTVPAATSVLEFFPVDFSPLTHGTWGTNLYLMY